MDQGQLPTCQECHSRPASVHFTQVLSGEKLDRYLCEDCAKKEGTFHFMLGPQFTVQHVLGSLIGGGPTRTEVNTKSCPHCGYTYQKFGETGRLGCDRCYEMFTEELKPLVRRLHGRMKHHGKIPTRRGENLLYERKISDLRGQMRAAVEHEDFEKAALLRDQIKGLEHNKRGGDVG